MHTLVLRFRARAACGAVCDSQSSVLRHQSPAAALCPTDIRTIVLQGRTLIPSLLQGLTTSIKADAQTPFGNFLYGCCTANAELIVDQLIFCNEGKHAVSRDDLLRDITAAVQRWIGDGGRAPDGGPVSTSEYS